MSVPAPMPPVTHSLTGAVEAARYNGPVGQRSATPMTEPGSMGESDVGFSHDAPSIWRPHLHPPHLPHQSSPLRAGGQVQESSHSLSDVSVGDGGESSRGGGGGGNTDDDDVSANAT